MIIPVLSCKNRFPHDEFERCVAIFSPNKQGAEYSFHASLDKG
ncbi:hypothetical protein VCCP10336_2503 [Vibrio cholerae CP1033(6)]|nr:hypothetical protein VCCP10336_2503 [Vibrio cholerae CP1033(6)]